MNSLFLWAMTYALALSTTIGGAQVVILYEATGVRHGGALGARVEPVVDLNWGSSSCCFSGVDSESTRQRDLEWEAEADRVKWGKALTMIVENRPATELSELLGGNALLGMRDDLGLSLLHWCAVLGRVEHIRTLRELGASFVLRDVNGNTPLHLATMARQEDAFKLLIRESPADVENKQGETPLHIAAAVSWRSACLDLLALGVAENHNVFGTSPACLALRSGAVDLGSRLVRERGSLRPIWDSEANARLHEQERLQMHTSALSAYLECMGGKRAVTTIADADPRDDTSEAARSMGIVLALRSIDTSPFSETNGVSFVLWEDGLCWSWLVGTDGEASAYVGVVDATEVALISNEAQIRVASLSTTEFGVQLLDSSGQQALVGLTDGTYVNLRMKGSMEYHLAYSPSSTPSMVQLAYAMSSLHGLAMLTFSYLWDEHQNADVLRNVKGRALPFGLHLATPKPWVLRRLGR